MNQNRGKLPFLVIPAYEPENVLLTILKKIKNKFFRIIVVNDGSSNMYEDLFRQIEELPDTVILKHPKNLGKGAALKTAFKYCIDLETKSCGVVTMDADGQHCSHDVGKIGAALMDEPNSLHLGKREFRRGIPWKSLVGNSITKYIYNIFVGSRLSDTQTGLRGIPINNLRKMLDIKSNAYDFELGMLLLAKQNSIKINEIPIDTIYDKTNSTSHFKPLIDSAKIYSVFLKYMANSMLIGLLDIFVFLFVYSQTNKIFLSFCVGRLVFCIISYKNAVNIFRSPKIVSRQAIPYLLLVSCSLLLSYSMSVMLVTVYGLKILSAKLISELMLFFYNFSVQQSFIFNRPKPSD